MKLLTLFLWLALLSLTAVPSRGESFKVVEKDFLWLSPNLESAEAAQDGASQALSRREPLHASSYRNYFYHHGAPPAFDFLQPLLEGDSRLARIQDGHILFRQTGQKVPLTRSLVPSFANPAPPYLVSAPGLNRVLVVYPYYAYQDKEARYVTQLYSDRGALISTFESLPTHFSLDNPGLLVSPEKSGCCESLKWTIRFYDARTGSVSEHGCPEGSCGDILFTKLGKQGPFLIVLEIVGKAAGLGASMQTNVYLVRNDGSLAASGKMLYALREPNLDPRRLESLSPFAISNLIGIDSLPSKDRWLMHYGAGDKGRDVRLHSNWTGSPPSVVFFLPKDPSMAGPKRTLAISQHALADLPLIGVAEPGKAIFEISSGGDSKAEMTVEVDPDRVNIILF